MSDSLADELAYRMERGEPWVLDWDDGSPGPDRELLARVVRALREADAKIDRANVTIDIAVAEGNELREQLVVEWSAHTALTAAVREATLPCDAHLGYWDGDHREYMALGKPRCGECPNCELRKMVGDE